MSWLINAFRNVFRKPLKYVVLLVLFFLSLTVVLEMVSMKLGIYSAMHDAAQTMGMTVTLSKATNLGGGITTLPAGGGQWERRGEQNNEKQTSQALSNVPLTNEAAQKLINSKYIEYYDYNIVENGFMSTISNRRLYTSSTKDPRKYTPDDSRWFKFTFTANRTLELNPDYILGKIKISEGRMYNQDDINNKSKVGIIDRAVAEYNNLKVGDKIKIRDSGTQFAGDENFTTEMEIIGLYDMLDLSLNGQNKVYVPYTCIQQIKSELSKSEITSLDSATYYLKKNEYALKFKEEAEKKGLDTNLYKLSVDENNYTEKTIYLVNLDYMVNWILAVAIIISLIVLVLSITIFIRRRRHEFGILRSLGIKIKRIFSTYFTEIVIVTILAFGLSFATCKLVGNATGNMLFKAQIEVANKNQNRRNNSVSSLAIDEINASPNLAGSLYTLGFGLLVCVCGGISTYIILKRHVPIQVFRSNKED